MQSQQRFSHWLGSSSVLRNLILGLTLAVAQFFTPAGVGTAQAATQTCTPNGLVQDCTVTFDYTGAAETWTVPDSVTSVTVDLYGGKGGDGGGAVGGKGAHVQAVLSVTGGETRDIVVAGQGGNGQAFGGGGRSSNRPGTIFSNGGGGASYVERNGIRLLVAGGGGGGGTGSGEGGNSGNPGGTYSGSFAGLYDGRGGGAGTGNAAGMGGAGGLGSAFTSAFANCTVVVDGAAGGDGQLGQGGDGSTLGGGGGGGYYGGGGGGSGAQCISLNFIGRQGGGGGGSSYIDASATQGSITEGVQNGYGQIIISYTQADTLAPLANPTQSPPPAPSGWNNTNVTVTWNWTDPATGSAYATGIDAANCTTSSVSSGSGTITLSATCKDLVGNTGTASYQVRVDPTAPTANPSQEPAANAAGWNNTDVTVNWNWGFTGAIIDTANCTTSSTSSGEGTLTLSATCKDVATNQRTATYQVKVDKTAPVVTVDNVTDGATYTLGSVPISGCGTDDALSGVATPAAFSRSGGNPDGTGSFTITCSGATDNAGNSGSASVSYTVVPLPDNTAPVITASVVGTLGTNGWYISDVSVNWSVVDNESAISSQSGCDPVTVTADTASVTFTCSATSAGGSSSESVTIQRDATAPVVTVTGVSNGASYTLGSVPMAGCDTSDALSGVATQATVSVTGGNPDGTGTFTTTCSGASDLAGNSAAPVSISYTVTAAPPPPLLQQVQTVRGNLAALLPSGDSKTDKALQKAIGKLDQALAANLWEADGNHLTLLGDNVFNRLYDAVQALTKIKNPSQAIRTASSTLVTISRALAQIALDEAIAAGGDASKIAKAQSKLRKGDGEVAKGKLAKAIAQYEDAWEYAQQALGIPVAAGLDPAADEPADDEASDPDEAAEEEATDPATLRNVIFLPQINR